jgi:hypothetical protein
VYLEQELPYQACCSAAVEAFASPFSQMFVKTTETSSESSHYLAFISHKFSLETPKVVTVSCVGKSVLQIQFGTCLVGEASNGCFS